jgi:uncharacterized membrane protein
MVLGFPFLLFCPGYALVSALFPRKDDLDFVERITLSVGLSIAIVPFIGLILHFTFGIKLYPVLFSMVIAIFLLSIVAWYRRRKIEEAFTFTIEIRWVELSRGEKVYRAFILLLIFFAFVVMIQTVAAPKIEKFTEFYILEASGMADFPKNLTVGESAEFIIGVRNHEAKDEEYRVVILLGDETIKTIDGIKLKHEERWEEKVSFNATKVGENMRLEFLLYKDEEPYRSLQLLINVSRTAQKDTRFSR